jgi:hypothetical protein
MMGDIYSSVRFPSYLWRHSPAIMIPCRQLLSIYGSDPAPVVAIEPLSI